MCLSDFSNLFEFLGRKTEIISVGFKIRTHRLFYLCEIVHKHMYLILALRFSLKIIKMNLKLYFHKLITLFGFIFRMQFSLIIFK